MYEYVPWAFTALKLLLANVVVPEVVAVPCPKVAKSIFCCCCLFLAAIATAAAFDGGGGRNGAEPKASFLGAVLMMA